MVKNSKMKQKKVINKDITKVRNLLILLLIVVLLCIGLYFITDSLLSKDNSESINEPAVKIDYDIATIGTMFNRPENVYYVLIYSSNNDGNNYDSILSNYRNSDNYIKTYFIDLDIKFNSGVLKESLNKNPKNSSEVSITGPTLYKIENGNVTKCYSTLEDISKILK